MLSPTRLRAVARKEVLQLARDPRSLTLAFLLPVLLLVLFGYAISWDLREIPTAVLDRDHSPEARALLEAFQASGYFTLVAVLGDEAAIPETLLRGGLAPGGAQLVLVIPPGFGRDLADPARPAPLQALVDGSDANTATVILGYTQAVVRSFSPEVAVNGEAMNGGARSGGATGVSLPVEPRSRVWFNEDLSSRNMIVPGLVAVVMMIIAAMLTSLTLAREWERGTMEQLAATPVTRLEVVLGKLAPYLGIGLIDVVVASVVGVWLFDVPFRGSPVLLMLLSLFFILGALGLGIFFSAVAKSQLLATQVAMIATFLPAFLLSGFMFAISVMPKPLQLITYLIPARYFLVITRGIFLKGVGLSVLWPDAALMLGFAVLGVGAAVRAFRKELG